MKRKTEDLPEIPEGYRFKVELLMNGRTFHQRYYCLNLEQLFNDIIDEFPNAKIVSIIGG